MILEDEEEAAAWFSLPFTALVRRERRGRKRKEGRDLVFQPRRPFPPLARMLLLGPRPSPSGPWSTLTASLRLCLYTISPLFLYTLRRNCDAPSLYLLVFSPLFPHPRPSPDEMERYIVLFCVVERVLLVLLRPFFYPRRPSVRVIDFRRRRGEMIKEKPPLLRSGK